MQHRRPTPITTTPLELTYGSRRHAELIPQLLWFLHSRLAQTFLFYDRADREPVSGPLTTELSTLQSEALSSPNSAQISPPKESDYLLIGNLVDFTGATGKGSQAWGQAIIDASNWINEHGGVAGKLFDLDTIETSYLVRRALPAYEKWLTQDVVAIQGYGTNIGMALKDKVAQNQIPYFSSAYAASFSAPEGNPGIAAPAPYNFFYGPNLLRRLPRIG